MAFTFGAKSKISISTANPILLSHTTIANTKLLVVGIMTKTTAVRTGGAPTYNGVAMTQVGSTMIGAAECTAELWYLSNPSIGTYNVSVPNAGGLTITVIASSYVDAGVNGAALDQYNSTNVTVANPSLSVTTGANGEVIVDVFGSGYNGPVGTGNQTLLYSTDEGVWCSHAQYALQANAGLITFSWTVAIDDVAFIVGAFKGITVTETIVAQDFPISHLPKPIKALQLTSKVEGATETAVSKDFPKTLLKSGKAKELKSKWS